MRVCAIDVGGHEVVRYLWDEYFPQTDAILFLVDSTDESRLDEANEELRDVMENSHLSGKPILILCNKQDLLSSLNTSQLSKALGLSNGKNKEVHLTHDKSSERPIGLYGVSILCDVHPKNELNEALNWLCRHL
jgi:GTP-binding protein SAR1